MKVLQKPLSTPSLTSLATDQADATVTVVGVNDAPVAVDVQLIPEDHAKTFDPTLNDSDVDNGDVLTLVDAELQPGSR